MVRGVGRLGTGAAQLESLQLTRAGLLRRGSVRLLLHDAPQPLLQVRRPRLPFLSSLVSVCNVRDRSAD